MKKISLLLAFCLLVAGGAAAQPDGGVRNVIYMIGDGMGLAHVSMLGIENGYGTTSFDRAQGIALVSTYSANNRVTDSAAAGTALATGHKTGNGVLGQSMEGEPFASVMTRASREGMPTGIAVTCYLQHATPAAFYAHVPDRDDNGAITRDLLESGVDVLFGGGAEWLEEECGGDGSYFDAFARRGYRVTRSLDEAERVDAGKLLCVPSGRHLPRAAERGDYLPRAVERALTVLSADAAQRDRGFLLMVEGSQIDMASHGNDAGWALDEMRDFDRAVAVAMDFADRTPGTLVVVVADHETGGLTIPACDENFKHAEGGIEYRFSTGGHTGMLVPVYLYGTGADRIAGIMDNTRLSQHIASLLNLPQH
mgnify:CR=1 FL=1